MSLIGRMDNPNFIIRRIKQKRMHNPYVVKYGKFQEVKVLPQCRVIFQTKQSISFLLQKHFTNSLRDLSSNFSSQESNRINPNNKIITEKNSTCYTYVIKPNLMMLIKWNHIPIRILLNTIVAIVAKCLPYYEYDMPSS